MSRSLHKKIYLASTALLVILGIYTTYKLLVSPIQVKLLLLGVGAIMYFVKEINTATRNFCYEVYCKAVYENSVFWEIFYDFSVMMFPNKEVNQINYGYAPLTKDGVLIDLDAKDENDRMSLQLYYRTITGLETLKASDLENKVVLEVSSGRAGGLEYILRKFKLKKAIGLDLSNNNVDWCKETHAGNEKLEFIVGNAQDFVDSQTLPAESVDIVISVDSAHLYPDFGSFVQQCKKVLRPGGLFCISDFMSASKFEEKEKALQSSGMTLVKDERTTKNILHAMDIDGERRKKLVARHSSNIIMKYYFEYQSGAKGSRIYRLLEGGEFLGHSWLWKKV
jgi:SAM-dependent methyltransferase